MHRTTLATALLSALLALPAFSCIDREVTEVVPTPDSVEIHEVPVTVNRNLDLLFVIDNSMSMREEHTSLVNNFGRLLSALSLIDGGLPNLHIGVVSSDMGLAPFSGAGCSVNGDAGVMHGATCPALGGARFLSDVADIDGNRVRNYSGTIDAAFTCMADVGTDGCGFEQHLSSMSHALRNGANAGFLRDDALLAVVIIADEDDCTSEDGSLFAPALGPLVNDFRCQSEGLVCDQDIHTAGVKTHCRPRTDSPYVTPIQTFVDDLAQLKGDPRRVAIGAIIGDPTDVEIGPDDAGRLTTLAKCPDGGLGTSEPGVRLDAFARSFQNSATSLLCTADLSQALDDIATLIGHETGLACLERPLSDRNPDLDGLQPECSVVEELGTEHHSYPACAPGTPVPCWRVVAEPRCPASTTGFAIEVDRGGVAPPNGAYLRIQCVVE